MSADSSSDGPICLRTKLAPGSSSAKLGRLAGIQILRSIVPSPTPCGGGKFNSTFSDEFVIRGLVHEVGELGLVGELDLHEPALAFGGAVDQSGVGFELL